MADKLSLKDLARQLKNYKEASAAGKRLSKSIKSASASANEAKKQVPILKKLSKDIPV